MPSGRCGSRSAPGPPGRANASACAISRLNCTDGHRRRRERRDETTVGVRLHRLALRAFEGGQRRSDQKQLRAKQPDTLGAGAECRGHILEAIDVGLEPDRARRRGWWPAPERTEDVPRCPGAPGGGEGRVSSSSVGSMSNLARRAIESHDPVLGRRVSWRCAVRPLSGCRGTWPGSRCVTCGCPHRWRGPRPGANPSAPRSREAGHRRRARTGLRRATGRPCHAGAVPRRFIRRRPTILPTSPPRSRR